MHPVQLAGLNVWNAIQNTDAERLKSYFSDDFIASMIGVMNGEKNKLKLGKKEMIATCMITGKAVNALFNYEQQYHLASWGKQKKTVFLIEYDQSLTFTPTTPPQVNSPQASSQPLEYTEETQHPLDSSDEVVDQEPTNPNLTNSAMLSKGVQAWEWTINDGAAVFTTLHNIEVDTTQVLSPLEELEKNGKICNRVSGAAFKKILTQLNVSSREIMAEELSKTIQELKAETESRARGCALM